jgi:hypothetical protein
VKEVPFFAASSIITDEVFDAPNILSVIFLNSALCPPFQGSH